MATQTPQIVEFPSIRRAGQGGAAPARFHERFGSDNHVLDAAWPRITTQASEAPFAPRRDGLRLLLINAPIREWSYPNILPIGHAYVAAVAAMDGHTIDVLDLNAERKQPVKSSPEAFVKWVESRVTDTGQPPASAPPEIVSLWISPFGDAA